MATITRPAPIDPSNPSRVNTGICPQIDQEICSVAGKIVHLTARLKAPVDGSVFLRGDKGVLGWDKDLSNINTSSRPAGEACFVFHVPTVQMNDTLMCKLVSVATDGTIKWQNSDNIVCDLSKRGHVVTLEVNNVSF